MQISIRMAGGSYGGGKKKLICKRAIEWRIIKMKKFSGGSDVGMEGDRRRILVCGETIEWWGIKIKELSGESDVRWVEAEGRCFLAMGNRMDGDKKQGICGWI